MSHSDHNPSAWCASPVKIIWSFLCSFFYYDFRKCQNIVCDVYVYKKNNKDGMYACLQHPVLIFYPQKNKCSQKQSLMYILGLCCKLLYLWDPRTEFPLPPSSPCIRKHKPGHFILSDIMCNTVVSDTPVSMLRNFSMLYTWVSTWYHIPNDFNIPLFYAVHRYKMD